MGTRHVFRPSRLLNLGPGLLLTALLGLAVRAAVRERLLPLSPWLIVVAAVPAVIAYIRWLLKGCVVVSRDEVAVRGWVTSTGEDGTQQRVYVRQYIPRSQRNSITIEGLLFPRVIWNRFGEKVTLEQVGQPRRFCRLLAAPAEEFAASERPSLILIVLYGIFQMIGWGISQGSAMLVRTVQRAHRNEPPPDAATVADDPLSYEDFCRYCTDLCARRPSATQGYIRRIYSAVLERAHMMTTRANGHAPGMLHPRITDIEQVTKRIPRATYYRMLREALHDEQRQGSPEALTLEPVLD